MVEAAERQGLRNPDGQSTLELGRTSEGVLIIPRFDVLTVGGPGGLFKSTVAEMLAGVNDDPRNAEAQARFHIDGLPRPFKVGQLVRAETEAKTGKPFIEQFDIPIEDDRRYDEEIRRRTEEARKPRLTITPEGLVLQQRDASILIEGRYAHIIVAAADERMAGGRFALNTERMLIRSSDDEQGRQVEVKRELAGQASHLDPGKLSELGLAREIEISLKAQLAFPELVMGQYIYDPNMKTPGGKDVFTVKVDAKGLTPSEILAESYKQLIQRGSLAVLSRQSFAPTPEGDLAFNLIKSMQRCQGLMEDNPCNRYAERTVDVYTGTELQGQAPACSTDHARNIEFRLSRDAEKPYNFSRNGLSIAA